MMAVVFLGIVLFFAIPIGGYVYLVAVRAPARGRAMQVERWQPLAARLGGTFAATGSGASYHTLSVPFGSTVVTVVVFDRAARDRELGAVFGDPGGWRTFVQAHVQGGRAPAVSIGPALPGKGSGYGDAVFAATQMVEPLLQTPPAAISQRLTPPVCAAFAAMGTRYNYLIAGPTFVSLELPGVCDDPNLIAAAVHVVGTFAQPA
jgi:hypothetical protein